MKKLIDYLLSFAWLLGAICLIVIFAAFIWAMVRAVIEIMKEDYESKRISAADSKDRH